jgi:hypothetical protein
LAKADFLEEKMGREMKVAKGFIETGLDDTWEGISNTDRSMTDRVSKGALGVASIGIGATIGLIGLGIKAVKGGIKASKKGKEEE